MEEGEKREVSIKIGSSEIKFNTSDPSEKFKKIERKIGDYYKKIEISEYPDTKEMTLGLQQVVLLLANQSHENEEKIREIIQLTYEFLNKT